MSHDNMQSHCKVALHTGSIGPQNLACGKASGAPGLSKLLQSSLHIHIISAFGKIYLIINACNNQKNVLFFHLTLLERWVFL
jgi:hypothetical protein